MSEGAVAGMGAAEAVASSGGTEGAPASTSPAAGAVVTPTVGGQVPAEGNVSPPPAQSWHEGWTPEQMAKSEAKGWKGPVDVVQAYMAAESKLGVDPSQYIALPTGKEDLAGIQRLRKAIGVPDTSDSYDISGFNFGEGMTELLEPSKKWAHEASLNQDQYETFVNAYATWEAASTTEITEARQALNLEQTQKVIGEWGDKADDNLARVRRFLEKNDFNAGQLEYVLGSEKFLKLGLAVDLATGEHVIGDRGGVVTQLGPTDAEKGQAKIDEMYGNSDFIAKAMKNKNSPEAKQLQKAHEDLWGTDPIASD